MRMKAALQQILASLLSVLQTLQQYPFHNQHQAIVFFGVRNMFPLKAAGLAELLMLAL